MLAGLLSTIMYREAAKLFVYYYRLMQARPLLVNWRGHVSSSHNSSVNAYETDVSLHTLTVCDEEVRRCPPCHLGLTVLCFEGKSDDK